MLISKRNLFLGIICFVHSFSIAQQAKNKNYQDKFNAVHWDVNAGLAHDKTYCILKDVYGFLWIGTDGGLSRFDGSTFKNYYYDPGNKESISGFAVYGLVEDSLHNIWIGTDKGLSRYDIKADTLTNFFPGTSSSSASSYIIPFSATHDEIYCQETDSFIVRYNVHSFKKEILIRLVPEDMLSDRGTIAPQYSFFDPSSNSIWMLSRMFHGGLLNISLSSGQRNHFKMPGFSEAMHYNQKTNSIWINTDRGLVEFTLPDKQFHHIDALKGLEADGATAHIGLDIGRDGTIWFLTQTKGIMVYDPTSKTVRPVFEDSALQKKIAEANSCIYCDTDGMTWTGSWLREGIWQLTASSRVVSHYNTELSNSKGLHTNDILNFVKGRYGEMWVGTGAGLSFFDIFKDRFITLEEKDLPGFKGRIITPVFVDTIHKKAWLRADENLKIYEMDIETRKCKAIVFRDSFNQTILPRFTENMPVHYKNGCIIPGIYNSRQCIFIVNSDSPVAKQVLSFPAGTIAYNLWSSTWVTDHLLFLRRAEVPGNLTYSDDGRNWTRTKSPMDSIRWSIIKYNAEDESYWVVAPRQLLHYDHDFRLIKEYTIDDGLPHDEIYGLIPDNKGNIWFNTYRSIYQLNVQTGQISILSEKDGFQPADFRDMGEGIAKDENGDLYFTTAGIYDGFKRIIPRNFVSPQSFVYIKALSIRDFFLPGSAGVNNIQQLSLKYFQNRINIETGTIDFYSQGKNHIRYKLEANGKKADWQYAPTNYTIRYEELPPGKYTLLIQAGNAGNEFIGPIKTIEFKINPAFWNTWWFRIGTAILVFGVFYILIRYRTQQRFKLRLERSGKEKQIAELGLRSAELQQQKIEMEMQALRAQMNPHFIFNSLNSINRFILQNNRAQASEYLTKFSKLVRMILQNSQASLISLESELESLDLYLNLESLRFNYHFDYHITVPKDLDKEVLQVPPLILQPYVENAIWHGLMHKEEKGHLDIEISENDDHLFLKIRDDGVGREKAKAMSSKSATKHKSMGLRITENRIAILQKNGSKESPVTIHDLVGEDGIAAGTEVIIKMPLIYD